MLGLKACVTTAQWGLVSKGGVTNLAQDFSPSLEGEWGQAEESGFQGYPWLHTEFKISLHYMRS